LLPDGKVFVAGGQDRQNGEWVAVASAEMFDPAEETWIPVEAPPHVRIDLSLVAMDGFVYALGGRDPATNKHVVMIDRYGLRTGTWTSHHAPYFGQIVIAVALEDEALLVIDNRGGTHYYQAPRAKP
jgi:hypothetical protein